MNKLYWIAASLCMMVLTGCAGSSTRFQPPLDSKQSPVTGSGYVAGIFSRDWAPGRLDFAFGIVNVDTAEEYVMPFGVDTALPDSVKDKFEMIPLPPGKYRIAYWLSYSAKDHKQLSRTDNFASPMVGTAFTLAPGEVVFIGSYTARYGRTGGSDGNSQWAVYQQRLPVQTVQKALVGSYPSFYSQPLSCPSCLK